MNTNSIRVASQRIIYAVAAFVIVAALILPAIASAAQVTVRSVALSNSSAGSQDVTYSVNFTPVGNAAAFVVDFCENTPLIGQACVPAAGFDASDAATATPGFTVSSSTTGRFVVAGTLTGGTPASVDVTGIDNPTADGPLYARIVTFNDTTAATNSTPENLTGSVDQGGVAISITDTIGVSGVVLESLTFCVAGNPIDVNCTNIDPEEDAPVLQLGEQVGDVVALTPGVISEGNINTQITTNAAGGVVVRIKSNATDCGGLLRAGDRDACDILPAQNQGITADANQARFGVKTAAATATPGENVNANGTLAPVADSFYNNDNFAFRYVEGNEQGVTSTFGDAFIDTNNAPANNQNMQLTFGATVSNNTPAGSYSTDISMIAVGKF